MKPSAISLRTLNEEQIQVIKGVTGNAYVGSSSYKKTFLILIGNCPLVTFCDNMYNVITYDDFINANYKCSKYNYNALHKFWFTSINMNLFYKNANYKFNYFNFYNKLLIKSDNNVSFFIKKGYKNIFKNISEI